MARGADCALCAGEVGMDAWKRMFKDEQDTLNFLLREEFDMNVQDLIAGECDIQDELIAVPCEDRMIHWEGHPFCSDCSCPCHDIQDGQYYELICQPLLGGLMTAAEANRLYFGEQL